MSTTTGYRYIANLDGGGVGEEEVYTGRMVGLRTMKDALRRHKVFWLASAVLGLVIGAAFHLAVPAKYTAVSMLYLTEPTTGSTYTLGDDVSLFDTSRVADRAANLLQEGGKGTVPGGYEGIAVGDVLMEIKADASTSSGAVRWANALASAFFSVRAETLGGQTKLIDSSLDLQATRLAADVQRLNNAITVLSGSQASPSTANQVAQLVSERGTDETQLTSLQNEVQQNLIADSVVNKGSYVLDPPVASVVHTKRVLAEDGLSGLVAGLAVGVGVVVVAAIISDRPRRRSEVAALLGAPVELSLRGQAEPARFPGVSARRQVKKPGAGLQLAQRRLREKIARLPRSSLVLVGVGKGSTVTAAVLLAGTALSLSADGKRVALVDMADGRPLARLFRARAKDGTVRTVAMEGKQLRLAVAPEDVMALDSVEVTNDAEAVLVLANADPATGAEQLRSWAEGAVVVVRAGKASDILIEATSEMLRGAGVPPLAGILVGADEEDETSGLVATEDQNW